MTVINVVGPASKHFGQTAWATCVGSVLLDRPVLENDPSVTSQREAITLVQPDRADERRGHTSFQTFTSTSLFFKKGVRLKSVTSLFNWIVVSPSCISRNYSCCCCCSRCRYQGDISTAVNHCCIFLNYYLLHFIIIFIILIFFFSELQSHAATAVDTLSLFGRNSFSFDSNHDNDDVIIVHLYSAKITTKCEKWKLTQPPGGACLFWPVDWKGRQKGDRKMDG